MTQAYSFIPKMLYSYFIDILSAHGVWAGLHTVPRKNTWRDWKNRDAVLHYRNLDDCNCTSKNSWCMTTKAQNTTPGGKHGSTVTRVFDYAFCLRLPPKHINQSNSDPREKVKDAGLLTFMWEGQFDKWLSRVSVTIGYSLKRDKEDTRISWASINTGLHLNT